MSSAQAAALAAFKGVKNDDKKQFKIPPPSRTYTITGQPPSKAKQVPRIQTKFVSPSPQKPSTISRLNTPTTPSRQKDIVRHTPTEPVGLKSPIDAPAFRSPAAAAAAAAEHRPPASATPRSRQASIDMFHSDTEGARSSPVDRSIPRTPNLEVFRRSSSQHSHLSMGSSTSLPQDTVKTIKYTIDSKAIHNDQSQKRLSSHYEPSEMIKSIKNSINSKQKSRVQTLELSQKNQALIEGFRESVDMKRVTSLSQPHAPHEKRLHEIGDHPSYDIYHDRSSDRTSNRSSIDRPFDRFAFENHEAPSIERERGSIVRDGSIYERPQRSSFDRPERHSLEKERSSFERPDKYSFERPGKSSFDKSDRHSFERRDRSSFDRPERSNSEKDTEFAKAFEKRDRNLSGSESISAKSDGFAKPPYRNEERQSGDDLAIYQRPMYSNSYSSIGSSISIPPIPSSSPAAPAIVIDNNYSDVGDYSEDADSKCPKKSEDPKEDQKPSDLGDIPEHGKLGSLQEAFVKVKQDRNISPITIPPSSNSFARSPNGSSTDNLIHTIPSPNVKISDSTRSLLDDKAKPKRKPPPEMMIDLQSSPVKHEIILDKRAVQNTPYSTYSSKSSISNQDDGYFVDHDFDYIEVNPRLSLDSQRSDSTKASQALPQFPEGKQKLGEHKPLFKRIHKHKGVDTSVNLLETSGDESETQRPPIVSRASAPITTHQNQPIQLKTTMRKTNKRKEKKYSFNENKPWKNHNDLHFVTEQERKRYEGVWVSNRGNYLNFVVTKLLGVDYDNQDAFKAVEYDKNDTCNDRKEISLKAARLSSKADSASFNDNQNFHNLKSAEINDLMHGIVVKRIWDRSRLPSETLRAIWNLVDFRRDGCLNKAEFLIGMWLVDQCLYGRKLPKKVDDTIWDSLGNIGVNVVVKKKGRR